jgi:hypothetical protein
MNISLKTTLSTGARVAYVLVATVMLLAGMPLFGNKNVAAAQFGNRSVRISDSSISGTSITSGVGSGAAVTYRVAFTSYIQASSFIIDFCSQDPIINDTCTTPTGMTAASATLTGVTGNIAAANNWAITTAGAGQVKIANDGVSSNDISQGGIVGTPVADTNVFELNLITNPSTVGTFYARMYTFANNTYGTYSGPTSVGNFVDYGGIALSTTNAITITARVQEQLTFCVTKANPSTWTTTNDCSDPVVGQAGNLPAVTIGHGSPTPIIDANSIDTSNGPYSGGSVQAGGGDLWTQLSTNATNGAAIRLRSSTDACPTGAGGLSADAGVTCAIPAHNGGNGTASAMTAGTAAFGLFVSASTSGLGGVGTLTPSAGYYNAAHTTVPTTGTPGDLWFGMDTTTANDNVISTYGSTLATTPTPVYRINNQYVFAATAALTTPAGIYQANLSMIATGTF